MAKEKLVIDPITRIEGHLRIEIEEENGLIQKAWSQSTMYRGIEKIVENRDPRDVWAFVQRICGVCTTTHALTSLMAVENAIGSKIPEQARLIRQLVLGALEIHDHVVHFYHLHAMDWVNVPNAAKADPAKAVEFANSIGSKWQGNNLETFTKVRDTVQGILDSGQLSIFTGGYWDHPDYRLPPEADLMCVAHYLDALQFQRSMIRINTVFGGKNPHPNFLVGGMACSIDPDSSESINQVQIDQIRKWVEECEDFVNNCYYPDVLALAGVYKDYFDIGLSHPNYMAVGLAGAMFAGNPNNSREETRYNQVKPGVILNGDFSKVLPFDPEKIEEFIASAWYEYSVGDDKGLHPSIGETTVKYTGPKPPFEWLGDNEKYSWSKEPRYDGHPIQTGPVSRMALAYAQGYEPITKLVDQAAEKLGITLQQLNSTMGRTFSRAAEAVVVSQHLREDFEQFVANIRMGNINVFDATKWEPSSWPEKSSGYGITEVPRGNLSHWVDIENGKVSHYQCVVPSTWLASGRDNKGVTSPYEEALESNGHHPLVDKNQPLEPLRTIHSFDPCMSCAVHIIDCEGGPGIQVMAQ